jgi:ABC-type nitrate/sulfonate/bicarbonate transport system substrate-binding protein
MKKIIAERGVGRNRHARRLHFLSLLFVFATVAACGSHGKNGSGSMESIRFGDMNVESSAFVYIAEAKGFFTKNGLNVDIVTYDTGPIAMKALMDDQVDLMTAGEFAFIVGILQGDPFSIIASMDKYQAFTLVARRDKGIQSPMDLKGKTIGVVKHALPEFYLGRFLELREIEFNSVKMMDIKPNQWVDAIVNGDVDAVVVSELYLAQIQAGLQDQMVAWPVQNYQDAYGLVFGKTKWISDHPEAERRFLKALAEAETYLFLHPEDGKNIVQSRLKLNDAYLAKAWSHHRFSLSLDESLVAAMEDETRWMIQNGLSSETSMPDYPAHISLEALSSINPDAVNVFH